MELNREQPTDDASLVIGVAEPGSEMVQSPNGLTPEQHVAVQLNSDAIHLGYMVEKGLIEYEALDKATEEDECGDYQRRLTASHYASSGQIQELVKEMRNEFMSKAISKAKSLRSTLIKRGILCGYKKEHPVKEAVPEPQEEPQEESQEEPQDESQPEPRQEEQDGRMEETEEIPIPEEKAAEGVVSKEEEINQLVVKINKFTSGMDTDPGSVDWQQFRDSLSKVCEIYQIPLMPVATSDRAESLQDLNSRVTDLRQKISGMECKMLKLDKNFEAFCVNMDSSRITKDRAERDMGILRGMQDRIGRRLAQMERDLQLSRECLLKKTKKVLEELGHCECDP